MNTVNEVADRVSALAPGESFIYHIGNLGADRGSSPRLAEVGGLMLRYGTDKGVPMYPQSIPGRLIPIAAVGVGLLHLTQRRVAKKGFVYIATRRM